MVSGAFLTRFSVVSSSFFFKKKKKPIKTQALSDNYGLPILSSYVCRASCKALCIGHLNSSSPQPHEVGPGLPPVLRGGNWSKEIKSLAHVHSAAVGGQASVVCTPGHHTLPSYKVNKCK